MGNDHSVSIPGGLLDGLADQATNTMPARASRGFVQWQIEVFLRHEPHAGGIEQAPAERAALLRIGDLGRLDLTLFCGAGEDLTVHIPKAKPLGAETANLLTSGPERTRHTDHVSSHEAMLSPSTRRCKTVAGLSPRSAQGGLNESTALRFYKHFRDVRHPPEAARSQPESMTNFVRIAPLENMVRARRRSRHPQRASRPGDRPTSKVA